MNLNWKASSPKRECWKTEEHSPKVEGDLTRDYKAMHEESFLSSWLRLDVESKATNMEKMDKDARKKMRAKAKKKRWKEERKGGR